MAQDLTQDIGSQSSFTITINSVADGSDATSSTVDLGAPTPFAINLTANFDGNSASNTDLCEIYAKWSDDNADFSDDVNDQFVGVVQMNGTTAVKKVFRVDVVSRYVQMRVANESGASMASTGNTLEYAEVAIDQA